MRLQRELVSTDLLNRFSGAGCPAPDPIFIVGLTRWLHLARTNSGIAQSGRRDDGAAEYLCLGLPA